jgi:hypothetical protein
MADFQAITTQEELDTIIKDRLKRDREAQAKKFEGWISPEDHQKAIDEANKVLNDYKAAHDGDEQTIADLKAKNQEYETAALKSRIAREVGLSYEWIGRITGTDEKSIRADAESLKELVGSQTTPAPLPPRSTETPPADAKAAALKGMLSGLKLNGGT